MRFQIGKSGITEGTLESLKLGFKTHKSIRINVLKSCCRDKEELKQLVEELKEKLPGNYKAKIIGYTVILRREGAQVKK